MSTVRDIPVWGVPEVKALEQMENCMKSEHAVRCALMADHHQGYAVPIGGVIAYRDHISPSGVGYDIGCGNKAVRLDIDHHEVISCLHTIMDDIFSQISFGVGRQNKEEVNLGHLEDHSAWGIKSVAPLKELARKQLGTVGSGNHYVDIFIDELKRVWCGVHFGSRGLGHKIATHYVKAGGGKDGINVDPVLLDINHDLGAEYQMCMELAGDYAYAGRDWVCQKVADILGVQILEEVHNHHNYTWAEEHFGEELLVCRKGATPCFPGQRSFVGGTMCDKSYILEGVDSTDSKCAMYSTVHGAGRAMGRMEAKGKYHRKTGECLREGKVTQDMMDQRVKDAGIVLRGAERDEAPQCYKDIEDVLTYHRDTIKIIHTLTPVGVAMAGSGTVDPYKD